MRRDTAWRLDPAITYLNHGSFGACPAPVLEAQRRWRELMEADAVRFFDLDLETRLANARRVLGTFLNADPEGFAFLSNATTGVATVLRSLTFEPGDELLTTDHEYNATINALAEIGGRGGARVVVARVPFPIRGPDQVIDAVLGAVTSRTRLAMFSHVTSPTAVIFPVQDLVRELALRGVDSLVDGAHAPGMVPVDLDGLRAAWWTGNGHKWLCGPKGSAVLWVREDHRTGIRPLVISHGANDPRAADGSRARFRREFDWPGTVDPTSYLALADGIGLVGGLEPGGWPAIMAANHALVLAGRDAVADALGIPSPVPDAMLGSMAALPLPMPASDEEATALNRRLRDHHGIVVPVSAWPVRSAREAGTGPAANLIRISAQRYNEPADYEGLASVLPRALAPAE